MTLASCPPTPWDENISRANIDQKKSPAGVNMLTVPATPPSQGVTPLSTVLCWALCPTGSNTPSHQHTIWCTPPARAWGLASETNSGLESAAENKRVTFKLGSVLSGPPRSSRISSTGRRETSEPDTGSLRDAAAEGNARGHRRRRRGGRPLGAASTPRRPAQPCPSYASPVHSAF